MLAKFWEKGHTSLCLLSFDIALIFPSRQESAVLFRFGFESWSFASFLKLANFFEQDLTHRT